MRRAPAVIAALVDDIGAPRRLIAREYVSPLHVKCSTPRFDRSDGPSGACLREAGSAAALSGSLIPGRAEVVLQWYRQCWRARNPDPSFAAQFRRIQRFSRACAPAIERADSRSEADRGAVAPEPKEWS